MPWWVALLYAATPEPLTFSQALEWSSDHPGPRAAAAELEARREGDSKLSSFSHSPSVNLSPGWRASPEADRGLEVIGGVQQSWNLGGLVNARREAARDERAQLQLSLRAQQLEGRLEAARAWLELWALEREATLVERELNVAKDQATRTERATKAGLFGADELAEAKSYVAETELAALDVEGARFEETLRLSAALGRGSEQPACTAGVPPEVTLPTVDQRAALLARAEGMPIAQQGRLEALALKARVLEVEAENGATLSTGVSLQRESPESWLVWLNLGLSVPLLERGQRGISEAQGAAAAAEVRSRSAHLGAQHTLALAWHEVEHSLEQETALREHLLPELERLVALRQRALESGEGTLLPLLVAQRRALQTERQLCRHEGRRRWSAVKLWLLLSQLSAEVRS